MPPVVSDRVRLVRSSAIVEGYPARWAHQINRLQTIRAHCDLPGSPVKGQAGESLAGDPVGRTAEAPRSPDVGGDRRPRRPPTRWLRGPVAHSVPRAAGPAAVHRRHRFRRGSATAARRKRGWLPGGSPSDPVSREPAGGLGLLGAAAELQPAAVSTSTAGAGCCALPRRSRPAGSLVPVDLRSGRPHLRLGGHHRRPAGQ